MAQANLPNGVTLEYEVHGNPTDPVIFVVLGITDNITDWPPGLYQPLVRAGYCVVLHELRDSGRSTKFENAGRPDIAKAKEALTRGKLPEAPYTIHDVADDAKLLLEHLGIRAACVVGYSFGSMVSQLLALKLPDQVIGLVCLQGSNYNPSLPQRLPSVEQAMFEATLDYPTEEEQIRAIMNLRFATNGSQHAMDAVEARQSAETSVARMYYPQGTARIILSRFATAPFFEETSKIACPTLVLQADEDPIFNLAHGEDIAGRISNATLTVLRGAGHNHPRSLQPLIAEQLIKFTKNLVDLS